MDDESRQLLVETLVWIGRGILTAVTAAIGYAIWWVYDQLQNISPVKRKELEDRFSLYALRTEVIAMEQRITQSLDRSFEAREKQHEQNAEKFEQILNEGAKRDQWLYGELLKIHDRISSKQ